MDEKFNAQFGLERKDYLDNLDFLNWYRYYFIVKEALSLAPRSVLEVGVGSGIVKNCLSPAVGEYVVMDINAKLRPDILGDLRDHNPELQGRFDCVIVADVLEHMPFSDLGKNLKNIYSYLAPGGRAIITIPHRRSHFLFMTPAYKPHVITVPTGFLSPGAFWRRFIKRKIWIDPHHLWEIGDGHVKRKHVERTFADCGFGMERFKKLLYVDFWTIRRTK